MSRIEEGHLSPVVLHFAAGWYRILDVFCQVLALLLSLAVGFLCLIFGFQAPAEIPPRFLPAYLGYLAFSVIYGLFQLDGGSR